MNAKRRKVEELTYKTFDILDPSGSNTDYWKKTFAKMSDTQFNNWLKQKFPYRFQMRPFEIEPDMYTINKALKFLDVPLTERVAMPFLYEDSDGRAVWSKLSLVGYIHIKKPKQFITKKNHMTLDIGSRDMKSGQLLGDSKTARQSDREFEAMQVMNLKYSTIEFLKVKGDAMDVKQQAYNHINLTGDVRLDDLSIDPNDSLAKHMVSAYMIGEHLITNIIATDYILPSTLEKKKARIARD